MSRRGVIASLLAAVLIGASWPTAAAAQPSTPSEVIVALAEGLAQCPGGKGKVGPSAVQVRDINGDRIADFHVDFGGIECAEGGRVWCGSGGCRHKVFGSMGEGAYRLVLDVLAQGVDFKRLRGRPGVKLGLHGSDCGRAGYERCSQTLYWNGFKFSSAN